jgi:hypothetical protein
MKYSILGGSMAKKKEEIIQAPLTFLKVAISL